MKTVHSEISKGQHDVIYREAIHAGEYRLRIEIRRDGFPNQSHARIEIFDPGTFRWNELANIHYVQMKTKRFQGRREVVSEDEFQVDRNNLIRQAVDILGIDMPIQRQGNSEKFGSAEELIKAADEAIAQLSKVVAADLAQPVNHGAEYDYAVSEQSDPNNVNARRTGFG